MEFSILLFKEFNLTLEHARVFFNLDLFALEVVDHTVFKNGDSVLDIGFNMRVVETELVHQQGIAFFDLLLEVLN